MHMNCRVIYRGWTLWCAPGSVNMTRKYCVLLPAAGRRTQIFHLLFTEPRAHHKVHPCRLIFNIIPNLVPGDIITIARESQGPLPSCFKTSADVTWSFLQIALLMHSCLECNTELKKSSPKSARNCCPSSIRISKIPIWT